jgi:CheY-like chemotaxis protein
MLPTEPLATRSQIDIIIAQLEGLERYLRFRSRAVDSSGPRSRERQLDDHRRQEVVERERAALCARIEQQAAGGLSPFQLAVPPRAVVAHRNAWFVGKLTEALRAGGVEVVATTANGADAIGIVIAENPELVLVEEHLEMVPGSEVVQDLHGLCPEVRVAAQAYSHETVALLLEAGACAVVTRQVPPADVATEVVGLLRTPRSPVVRSHRVLERAGG